MSQQAEVRVRIRQEGAEETKQRLLETKAAMLGVSTQQLKNAHSTRELARDANILNNMERFQTRIFLAQHPVINNLTRAMSTFGSVSRGVLSITTAFSTAILAFNSTTNGLAEVQSELDQARREQALALEKYGYDSEEYATATEKVNELEGKMKALNDQLTMEKISNGLNFAAMIGVVGGSISTLVNSGVIAKLVSVLGPMGLGGVLAAGAILAAVVAIVVGAIALAFYLALTEGDQFQQFVNQFFPELSGWVEDTGKIIDDVFAMHIPNAFIFMANTAIDVFNTVNRAFAWLVNQFIGGINNMIKAANKVASAIGLPTMKLIPEVQAMQAPNIAYLESRNWGAGGPGTYSGGAGVGQPAGSAGSRSAPNVTVINNIAGSVLSDIELKKLIDQTLKNNLKGQGWT